MQNSSGERVLEFQKRLADEQIDMALIHDPDSIFYLAGFWDYLGMEFGRPTILIVPQSGPRTLVTPGMEAEMATNMTWVEDIREWTDGIGGEWQAVLDDLYEGSSYRAVGIENYKLHPVVFDWVKHNVSESNRKDISAILADMRMLKNPEDIDTMPRAGQVARRHV